MAGNFWDQDELVSPAPAQPTTSAPAVQAAPQAPAAQESIANPAGAPVATATTTPAPAVQVDTQGATPAAPPKNFWEGDEVVTPAPPPAEPAKPQRSFTGELGHQLGLTARAGINGLLALPAMAADAIAAPINAGLDMVSGKGNGYRIPNQAQAVNNFMDSAGVAKPENATERVVQDATTAMAGSGATIALGHHLISTGGPLATAAGKMLTQGPQMQLTSAATSGAASGGVREAGGGAGAQLAAGVAGAMLPGVATAPFRTVIDPNKSQLAASARNANEAGYVIPPADLSESSIAQLWGAIGGKIKTSQEASFRNQSVSNKLAKQALGMAEDQVLDSASLAELRKDASRAYAPVANAGTVVPTQKYADALDDAEIGRAHV